MKKIMLATTAATMLASGAFAAGHEINVGVLLSFTGPIESLTPDMAAGAELAIAEVNASGLLLDGKVLVPVRADGTCIDSAAATAAAEALISTENVVAIMGADCSGITTAVANNVGVPNGVVMISPSATSPALSDIDDNGLFFRTAPSDARQGEVLASILVERGVASVALTYTNNDYGKGLADAFQSSFEAAGGVVTISAAHEDGKGDYSAEVGALAAAGGDMLAVMGYADQGGVGIIQAALDTGAFDSFVMGDGMRSQSIVDAIGEDLEGSFGTQPGSSGEGAAKMAMALEGIAAQPDGPYTAESYDAAALIALAIQAGGSADRASIAAQVLNVANAPGEQIGVGELAKGLEILANGGEIDYQGASDVELIGPGEAAGSYQEWEVEGGTIVVKKIH